MSESIGPEYITADTAPRLLVIAGPSGVGKASITRPLLESPAIHRTMTYTTRPPRPDEKGAGQYHFVSREAFEAKYAKGIIMEREEVYGTGHLYGMPADLLDAAPPGVRFVLAEVDVHGADFLRARFGDRCVTIFVTATPDDLRHRIIQRAREKGQEPQDLDARLQKAREHMRHASDFDYLVFNHQDRLNEAIAQVRAIVQAERLRVPPDLDLESAFWLPD